MISRKLIVEAAAEELDDCLRAQGFCKFLKARDEFVRNSEQKQDRVALDVFKWPAADSWNLTFRLKVRFEPIESLRNRQNVASGDARHTFTLTRLIDTLYPKTIDHFQWPISTIEHVREAGPEMRSRIVSYALPFFERFRDFGAVRQAMESELGDWPVPTPLARAEVLLACLALTDDSAGLLKWIAKLRAEIVVVQDGAYQEQFESFVAHLAAVFPQMAIA